MQLPSAGRAPGYAGLNQINLALPAKIISGRHSLVVKKKRRRSVRQTDFYQSPE